MGIMVSWEGFQVGPRWVPLTEQWFITRKVLVRHFKVELARSLSERRPLIFGGLQGWNHRQHNRILMRVTPYERMVLLRLWTGSTMCQHKRHQAYGESPKCQCGHEDQNVWHLLWECPCVPIPPISLDFRRHLPRAQSVAHLLPENADRHDVETWRDSCFRAIRILSRTPEVQVRKDIDVDTRGHDVGVNSDGTYAYCRKCYISRRVRDKKRIWVKDCKFVDRELRTIGESWEWNGHSITLKMARWKIMSERPAMVCARCGLQVWATAGYREHCYAVD